MKREVVVASEPKMFRYPMVAPMVWRRVRGDPPTTPADCARTAVAVVGGGGGGVGAEGALLLLLDELPMSDGDGSRATFALYSLRGRSGGSPASIQRVSRVSLALSEVR